MGRGQGSLGDAAVRTSSRGEVDPFIVMDVMEAARAEEARGRSVIHMEVGQPGTPAPAAARAALARAMEAGPLGYTVALGLPALRARIARLYARLVRGRSRPGAGGGDRRVVGRLHPGLHQPLRRAATGWRSASRAIRAIATSCARSTSCRSGSRPGPRTASSRCRAISAADLAGVLVASPANPTGTMLARSRARAR